MEYVFTAPTEELELKLVTYCTNVLNLELGEFWYSWFPSHAGNNNQTIHIECNVDNLESLIRETFHQFVEIVKFHKLVKNSLPDDHEFKFQYYIHFKSVEKL